MTARERCISCVYSTRVPYGCGSVSVALTVHIRAGGDVTSSNFALCSRRVLRKRLYFDKFSLTIALS